MCIRPPVAFLSFSSFLARCALLVAASFLPSVARAQQAGPLAWDPGHQVNPPSGGTVAGAWDLGLTPNWSNTTPASAPWTDGTTLGRDTAFFAGTAGNTVSVASDVSARGVVVMRTGYTLAAAGGTLRLGESGFSSQSVSNGATTISAPVVLAAPQTWTVGPGSTLTMSGALDTAGLTLTMSGPATARFEGVISGSGSITNIYSGGNSIITLAGANTFSGGVRIISGNVSLASASALGTGTFSIPSATAVLNGAGTALTLTTNNAMTWEGDWAFNGASVLNLGTGAVTMQANVSLTVEEGMLTVGGPIAGAGRALTKTSAGTLILGGASTYTGGTTVSGGTLTLANTAGSATGTGSVLVTSGKLAGTGAAAGAVTLQSGTSITGGIEVGGLLTVNAGGSVALDAGGGTLRVLGSVTNNGTMRFKRGSGLAVSGPAFVNNGLLDWISGSAVLPANFTNGANGVVLDPRTVVKVKDITSTGSSVTVRIDSNTAHTYRLQRAASLTSGFADVTPVSTQTGTTGTTLAFTDPAPPATRAYYRVAIDP